MSKDKLIDITAFDAVSESETGFDLKLMGTDGLDTGVIFTIIGKNSDVVTNWQKKQFNAFQRESTMAQKRGKTPEPKSVDELRAISIEGAMIRVTGWKNVTQPFSVDVLKRALERNPHFVEQIVDASDDLGNFTKNA